MTDNPYPLALALARPVARGWLSGARAGAAMAVAALRYERAAGWPAPGTLRVMRHLYAGRLGEERMRLAIVAMHARWEAKRHGR